MKGLLLGTLAVVLVVMLVVATGCKPKEAAPPPMTNESMGVLDPMPPPPPTPPPIANPPPPMPPEPLPLAGGTYTVQKGDTLFAVARKAYNDQARWKDIAAANNLQPPYTIKVGQVLKLPK